MCLDIMVKNKIIQQAYHSQSFICNHCAKYIKPNITEELYDSIVSKCISICSDLEIIETLKVIAEKYKKLNKLYFEIHSN